MASSIIAPGRFEQEQEIWQNLKLAIAASSGFQRWQQEQTPSSQSPLDLDEQVSHYLRETLETLAY